MFIEMSDLRAWQGNDLGDLSASSVAPLAALMNQWQAAIAAGNASLASTLLTNAANLADNLSNDPSAAPTTASYLGNIASEAGQLGTQAGQGDLSFMTDGTDVYANLNATVNLIVSGAAAYAAGTNVTPAASAQTAAGIAAQQQALQAQIASFQPGGKWDPTEILGISAAALSPLQATWQQINSVIQNSSLTDSDRSSLLATQADMVRALGVQAAAASAAGSSVGAVIDGVSNCLTNPSSCAPTACSTLSSPLKWMCNNWQIVAGVAGVGLVALYVAPWAIGRYHAFKKA
jgi:hypothetical protein